uniref:Putative sugar kinase n=1 Tax=Rhizophora mucronata TaxID=61149 RepID=A0A2P2K816_RHIMU
MCPFLLSLTGPVEYHIKYRMRMHRQRHKCRLVRMVKEGCVQLLLLHQCRNLLGHQ